jgi:ArsR family transcriptional regulator, lead/cadmium/zinc/bismuth-responsive transcriptional repressor
LIVVPRSHEHPVNSQGVAAARDGVLSVADAGRLAGLLGMLADPVRSRILFALVTAEELCVGDLALALDVTEDQVSYGLKMLRLAGLVSFRRDGRMVFYRLSDGFPHPLLEHCLRQLLTIAAPPQAGARPLASADPETSPARDVVPAQQASPTREADRARP